MKASSVNINKSIQAISLYLVRRMSREEGCSEEKAFTKILKTLTYEMLQDKGTQLYAESPEYVWGMLRDEQNGNLETWTKK